MKDVKMKWLDTRVKGGYVTFGVPHSRGEVSAEDTLSVIQNGAAVAADTKPAAYWNDGSVKWTSVTARLGGGDVTVSKAAAQKSGEKLAADGDDISVDNGIFKIVFHKSGSVMAETENVKIGIKAVKTVISNEDDVQIKKNIPYYGNIKEIRVSESAQKV